MPVQGYLRVPIDLFQLNPILFSARAKRHTLAFIRDPDGVWIELMGKKARSKNIRLKN